MNNRSKLVIGAAVGVVVVAAGVWMTLSPADEPQARGGPTAVPLVTQEVDEPAELPVARERPRRTGGGARLDDLPAEQQQEERVTTGQDTPKRKERQTTPSRRRRKAKERTQSEEFVEPEPEKTKKKKTFGK